MTDTPTWWTIAFAEIEQRPGFFRAPDGTTRHITSRGAAVVYATEEETWNLEKLARVRNILPEAKPGRRVWVTTADQFTPRKDSDPQRYVNRLLKTRIDFYLAREELGL